MSRGRRVGTTARAAALCKAGTLTWIIYTECQETTRKRSQGEVDTQQSRQTTLLVSRFTKTKDPTAGALYHRLPGDILPDRKIPFQTLFQNVYNLNTSFSLLCFILGFTHQLSSRKLEQAYGKDT